MISPELLARLACPRCLEARGCAACARPAGHAACADYAARVSCACGGPDKVALVAEAEALACPCCGRAYARHGAEGWADLWTEEGGEAQGGTLYDDHEFQERLRVSAAPPLLSARVKADLMRGMLDLRPGEAVLDLGCGAGKMALYATGHGARATGVDAAHEIDPCLLYTSPSPRDGLLSRMPSSA